LFIQTCLAYVDRSDSWNIVSIGIRNENVGSTHSPHLPFLFLEEEVLSIGVGLHTADAELYLNERSVWFNYFSYY
jgi:hypothetical protein